MSATTTAPAMFPDLESFGASVNAQIAALQTGAASLAASVAALQTSVTALEVSLKAVTTAQNADQAGFVNAVKALENALAAMNLGPVTPAA